MQAPTLLAPASAPLGSPLVQSARLQLENGKTFQVDAINQSDKNVYVQKVLLNGKLLTQPEITHSDILKGGMLTFYMAAKPTKK